MCDQQRLRRACAPAQSRQNHRCSLTEYRELDAASGKEPHLYSYWVDAHVDLKDHETHKPSLFSWGGSNIHLLCFLDMLTLTTYNSIWFKRLF